MNSSTGALSDLRTIIDKKRSMESDTCGVVTAATEWLRNNFEGAGIQYGYASCANADHYGYAVLTVIREKEDAKVALKLKIAEIESKPYAFADVYYEANRLDRLFPFFGEIASEEGRRLLLHYISDYVLGTER